MSSIIKVFRTSRRALESLRPCGLAACSPWLLPLRLLLRLRLRLRLRLLPGRLPKKRRKLRKWSPGGSKIDPRRRQNCFLEASGGLLGARWAPGGRPGRSETASGRLLGRSWRLLGRSWDAPGASWGRLGPPGALPGGSRGGSGRPFWEVMLEASPGRLKKHNFE